MSAETILTGIPICGVTGVNGTGKTLLAVTAAVAALRAGRDVYSTVPVHDPVSGRRSVPITSLGQLLRIRNALILLDEVATILPGGNASPLPSEVRVMLGTLRHSGNTVIWTAPAWMRAHVELREVTQAAAALFPIGTRRVGASPWPTPVLVGASLLDTRSGKTDETPTRVLRRRIYLPKRLAGWGSYDTHADTPLLGRHLAGGRCPDCGGARDVPKHTEQRHVELGLPWFDDDAEQRRFALLEPIDAGGGARAYARIDLLELVHPQSSENTGPDSRSDEQPAEPEQSSNGQQAHEEDREQDREIHPASIAGKPVPAPPHIWGESIRGSSAPRL